jgi:hypothetical protein
VEALDNSRAIVVYRDGDNSNIGRAVLLTVSGTTITVTNNKVVFSSASVQPYDIALWGENKTLVVYRNIVNNTCEAVMMTVDGKEMTVHGPYQFHPHDGSNFSIAILNETTAVVVGRFMKMGTSAINGFGGGACVLTLSGSTITVGTMKLFSKRDVELIANNLVALSDNTVLVAYADDNNETSSTYYGTAVVLTVNGTSLTVGTHYTYANTQTYDNSVSLLADGKVLVSYADKTNQRMCAAILNVNGTVITLTDIVCSKESYFIYQSNVGFTETQAVVLFGDGTYVGLSIDGSTITVKEQTYEGGTFVQPATSNLHNVGVAKTSGIEGETVEVYCAV